MSCVTVSRLFVLTNVSDEGERGGELKAGRDAARRHWGGLVCRFKKYVGIGVV